MASVRLDIVRVSRCDTKTYLAFSAQIMGTQRLLLTLAMVTFLFDGCPTTADPLRNQIPVNILFQRRILLLMERENYKV
jgi:hypothetical protein